MDLSGYSLEMHEKIERLSDILVAIGDSEFLRKRLSLYGGTALNLVHSKDPPRLSEDLDFNYRHVDWGDWGEVRTKIDLELKGILHRLGYKEEDVHIQPQYNLGRFFVKYRTRTGQKDLIKIEIGYMRRISDLKRDSYMSFRHSMKPRTVKIRTPKKEELFANKFCTMFSRMRHKANFRDIFDVATISKSRFNNDIFLDVAIMEILLMDLDIRDMRFVDMDMKRSDNILSMVKDDIDLENILAQAKLFSNNTLEALNSRNVARIRTEFVQKGKIEWDLFRNSKIFHSGFEEHPQLLWLRTNRKK
jgi:predicted nucleotidyltransferase component of viral defense system